MTDLTYATNGIGSAWGAGMPKKSQPEHDRLVLQLQALQQAWEQMHEATDILSGLVFDAQCQLVHYVFDNGLSEDANLEFCSAWACPNSPIGCCAYNLDEDPAMDDCLFCHQPRERK